jgi:AbrB family looped-hinge helix DNA binding protein
MAARAAQRTAIRCALLKSHYRSNVQVMTLAQSKLTAQGQISVPAEVRRRLGIGPGSLIEWEDVGGDIVVRRVGRYTSTEVHEKVFPYGPSKRRSLAELKEGVRRSVRRRRARS